MIIWLLNKDKQIIQRISSDDLSMIIKSLVWSLSRSPYLLSIEDCQLIILYDIWRTNKMLFCWLHYAHLLIIWLLSDDFQLIFDHHWKLIRRSYQDLLMIIWRGSSVLLWLLCVEYLLITCSCYDYCLLNISRTSVYYPMIIWWLPDDYLLIISLLFKDHLIMIWWLSDDHLTTIWWLFEDQLMNIWRSSVDHLKINICLFEDCPVLNIYWSSVDYDDYLITIWLSPEDHLMTI